MEGFVAKRLLKSTSTSELVRRAIAIAPRIFVGSLLPALLLFLPAIGVAVLIALSATTAVRDVGLTWGEAQLFLDAYSVLVVPVLAGSLAAAAIRVNAGARPGAREVLGSAFSGIRPALTPALAAGALTLLGFGLFVPGWLLGAALFVVGPVAVVEGGNAGQTLKRSWELTRGNRWPLFGVAFVLSFVEHLLLRAAVFFVELGDAPSAICISVGVMLLASLVRASAAAVAYNDLRVGREGLEIDALANELGGARSEEGDAALSERAMERFAKRRGLLGGITGQSASSDHVSAVASVRDLEKMADRRRAGLFWARIVVAGLIVVGVVAAAIVGVVNHVQENRRTDAMVAEVQAREHALGEDAATRSIQRDELSRLIVTDLAAARPKRRLELLGRTMAVHSRSFYGPGFDGAFKKLAEGASGEKIIRELDAELAGDGCEQSLEKARSDKNSARSFAEHCPPNEASPIDPRRFHKNTDLGRAVLAQLLEIRARDARLEEKPLHRAILDVLL